MKMDPVVHAAALRQFEESGERCWCCDVLTPWIDSLHDHREKVIEALLERPDDEELLWKLDRANRDIRLADAPVESPWMH